MQGSTRLCFDLCESDNDCCAGYRCSLLDPDDPNRELTALAGMDLARGWRLQAGLTRDLDSDINLLQDIRAIYEDDCTFLEISYTRSETQRGTIGPDEGLQIRVGLRSLGVFGGS